MIDNEIIETKHGAALGTKIKLWNAPLLIMRAMKGYIVCGYFSKETVEKMKDCAVIVTGVKSFNEMLDAKPSYISRAAKRLGIRKTMTCAQALDKMV